MRSKLTTLPNVPLSTILFCGILPVACCVMACGCGGGGSYDLVPVSGKVTLDGNPVSGVDVSFQPTSSTPDTAAPGSFGKTDAEGRYTLKTIGEGGKEGAVAGKHIVRLSMASGEDEDEDAGLEEEDGGAGRLPPECTDGSLNFDVPSGGTDKADFDLQSN